MAEPYIGEIRVFSGNFAPDGWAMCNGQLLSIAANEALYSLLGATYGGDGSTTFALPNLGGRVALHKAPGYSLGQMGGSETVTLTSQNMPAHSHPANAKAANGTSADPVGRFWAGNNDFRCYSAVRPDATFATTAIGATGGSEQHDNMMPFLTVTFIIALEGIYPSFD